MTDDEYRRPMDEREIMQEELDRAWRAVDAIAYERDKMMRERDSAAVDLEQVCDERDKYKLERNEHLEWCTKLADDLDECERMRDALGVQLNKYHAVYEAANALMARLGHDGTIDTNSPLVETMMNALDEINPKG